ncbi:MAG: hypothetical protein ACP5FL_03885 [Thermoplasmatota archaeon]
MAAEMFKGDIERDLFCQIILDLLSSWNLLAGELKQKAKSFYKEKRKEELQLPLRKISDAEYYYRIRRLKHDGIIQKRGQEYILLGG